MKVDLGKKTNIVKNPKVEVEVESLNVNRVVNNLKQKKLIAFVEGFGALVLLEGKDHPENTPANKKIGELVKKKLTSK